MCLTLCLFYLLYIKISVSNSLLTGVKRVTRRCNTEQATKKKKVVLSTCKEGYLTIMNTVLFHCTGVEKINKKITLQLAGENCVTRHYAKELNSSLYPRKLFCQTYSFPTTRLCFLQEKSSLSTNVVISDFGFFQNLLVPVSFKNIII